MRLFLFALLLSALLTPRAGAQTISGSIGGTVTDASHNAVTGATVTIIESATAKKRATVSDAHGDFLVPALPAGGYQLEVEHPGYGKHVQRLTLGIDQELRVDVPLLPGSRTESVQVTATPPVVRTESAAMGALIENRNVVGLPLDGRNFYQLALLTPGVVPAAQGSAGAVLGDIALNMNGGREDANNFLLDGIYNGDPKLNTFGITPSVDAVQEFEVLTSVFDASFGRNSGGQVNVVLKTGSNAAHGTLYEFFRNAELDGRNYFAPADAAKPQYQRNQFGGSMGGPIRKNKTFFFLDYEGYRVRRESRR